MGSLPPIALPLQSFLLSLHRKQQDFQGFSRRWEWTEGGSCCCMPHGHVWLGPWSHSVSPTWNQAQLVVSNMPFPPRISSCLGSVADNSLYLSGSTVASMLCRSWIKCFLVCCFCVMLGNIRCTKGTDFVLTHLVMKHAWQLCYKFKLCFSFSLLIRIQPWTLSPILLHSPSALMLLHAFKNQNRGIKITSDDWKILEIFLSTGKNFLLELEKRRKKPLSNIEKMFGVICGFYYNPFQTYRSTFFENKGNLNYHVTDKISITCELSCQFVNMINVMWVITLIYKWLVIKVVIPWKHSKCHVGYTWA